LNKGFFAFAEEIFVALLAPEGSLLGELLCDAAAVFVVGWHRHNVLVFHKVEKLPWDFFQGLLGQLSRVVLKFPEWHELDDICRHVSLVSLGVKRHLVGIENIHTLEVIAANSNNDDREGQLGAAHDLVDRLLHVIDDTIRDDQQNVILLVCLVDLL